MMRRTGFFLLLLLTLPLALGASQVPLLQVALLDYTPSPVQPGQTIDIRLEIASQESLADNVWLTIEEEHPFEILESQDLTRAQNLKVVSGSQILQFRIRVNEHADDGSYPLTIRYGVGDKSTSQEITFDIIVETFDARIGIESIEQTPVAFSQGEEGMLRIKLRNYDDRPLHNIDVTLDYTDSYDVNANMNNMISVQAMVNSRLEDVNRRVASGLSPLVGITPMMQTSSRENVPTSFKVLSPRGLSSRMQLPTLDANEMYVLEIPVRALTTVSAGLHALPMYVSYNDEDNNPFHVRVEIPIVIDEEPQLYIDISATTLRTPDFGGEVQFTIANRGSAPLRYVTLELQETGNLQLLTAPRSVYVGDLQPGEFSLVNFSVLVHEEEVVFPVLVKYRDTFNNDMVSQTEIPFTIINKNYYRDLPYEMWLAWLILGGVILALTFFYVARMRKNA